MFLAPNFLGERPPRFWSGIIKFNQIPTMWQSFRAIGRGSSENEWRNKKKEVTSAVKHKPVRNGGSGRPKYDLILIVIQHRRLLLWASYLSDVRIVTYSILAQFTQTLQKHNGAISCILTRYLKLKCLKFKITKSKTILSGPISIVAWLDEHFFGVVERFYVYFQWYTSCSSWFYACCHWQRQWVSCTWMHVPTKIQ